MLLSRPWTRSYDKWLEKLTPHEPVSQYHHNDTGEDNADAHMKRQIMGHEVVVAITDGEFDGQRHKQVLIMIAGEYKSY